MVGPCRPVVKDGKVVLDDAGNPVARRQSSAWVQVFAVALAQTKNTMKMFSVLASPQLKRDYTVVIGKEQVVGLHGEVTIEAVTSSPETREGNRPTFQIGNEALALDTPIPTPTGWTTMGDLRDGDVIFGSDGRPTTVVKAQPVRLGAPCYRVTFEDGTSMVASDDHRWFAQPKGPYKTRVWTTREMVDDGRRFYIPRAGVRQTTTTDLPVDPYLLGAWLGDGSTGQAYIASAWGDVDTLREQLRARGIETTVNKGGSAARVGLSSRRGFGSEMGTDVARAMRSLDCWRDKHIPTQYLHAGTEQRAELLRGLMDTDGCATTDGKAVFVGREVLTAHVLELLRSLGQKAQRTFVPDSRSREGGYWRVQFTPRDLQPFSFPRKAERIKGTRRKWVRIDSIEPVESVPVRCIEVDAPDHLFQAGEAGHVTHNCHHWKDNNAGHEMREVMDRNNKLPLSRILWITNAYNPSQMSVGQSNRESWENSLGEDAKYVDTGVMYDSLEAPENARMVKRELAPVLEAVRGDSHWVDIEGIISRILDSRNPTSTSRRFYFNQVGADEEAWVDPQDVDSTVHPQVKAWRTDPDIETDSLRLGWAPVRPQDEVVVFFDGGKSDDHTAISGCRLSDGYTFGIGFWGRPKTHDARLPWFAPRTDVDERMVEAHERFNVIALWADPSHAKDDEDDSPYWDGLLDEWHRRWKDELKFWAVKTGDGVHSVKWDMTSPVRQGHFVEAAQEFVRDMQEHSFQHCGHPMWVRYMKNAKRVMSSHGVTLWKGSRGSKRKIDGAVTHVGARMMRKMILNRAEEQKPRGGRFWY